MRLGIIGVGGFAGRHHGVAQKFEEAGEVKVVATCDPSEEGLKEASDQWRFRERGVREFGDYRKMLDECSGELDLVIIPTPIPLHAEMHRACVERGLAVYLEKPPTLDPAELENMIRVDAGAAVKTTVGFNLVADEDRRELKRRLLSGEFGALQEVAFTGRAPRPTAYFQRAGWAGKLRSDGRLLLDSCFGNAMAHYVHNALLWAGPEEIDLPAAPDAVEAELYRAHPIDGADTFFVAAETSEGVRLRIAMTHACVDATVQEERLECERATIRYRVGKEFEITWKQDGEAERKELTGSGAFLRLSHRACYQYLRGERNRPLTTLSDCRPFVHLNGLAYVSAGDIVSVPEQARDVVRREGPDGELEFIAIRGIEEMTSEFADTGKFPSESGFPWAKRPERRACPEDLPLLARFGL